MNSLSYKNMCTAEYIRNNSPNVWIKMAIERLRASHRCDAGESVVNDSFAFIIEGCRMEGEWIMTASARIYCKRERITV